VVDRTMVDIDGLGEARSTGNPVSFPFMLEGDHIDDVAIGPPKVPQQDLLFYSETGL